MLTIEMLYMRIYRAPQILWQPERRIDFRKLYRWGQFIVNGLRNDQSIGAAPDPLLLQFQNDHGTKRAPLPECVLLNLTHTHTHTHTLSLSLSLSLSSGPAPQSQRKSVHIKALKNTGSIYIYRTFSMLTKMIILKVFRLLKFHWICIILYHAATQRD